MPNVKLPKMMVDTDKILELRAASGCITHDQFSKALGLTKPTVRTLIQNGFATQRIVVALCMLATKVYKRTISPSHFAKNVRN